MVVPIIPKLLTYHTECYIEEKRSFKYYTLSSQPINGNTFKSITIASLALSFVVLLNGGFWFVLPLLLLPGIRLYSWMTYEKDLHVTEQA